MGYASPDALLEDVQLTLENDARWYRWCNLKIRGSLLEVEKGHWRNALRYFYHPANDLDDRQRMFLRHYFQWRYRTDQTIPPPEYRQFDALVDYKTNPFKPAIPPTFPPKEKPVSTKLTFKTQYLLNGVSLDGLSKEDIYVAISAEEKRLEKLREIKHQPKSLKAEIEAGEANLQALVEHLDSV